MSSGKHPLVKFVIGCGLVLLAVPFLWLGLGSIDADAPDVSDLAIDELVVPDGENGMEYLADADAVLDWPESEDGLRDYERGKPADVDEVGRFLDKNHEAMVLLRRAAGCGLVASPGERAPDAPIPDGLSGFRLPRLMQIKARHAMDQGRYHEAAEASRTLAKVGFLICRDAGCLLDYVIGAAWLGQATTIAQAIAREPEVDRDTLLVLWDALQNPESDGDPFVRTMKGEFHMVSFWIGRGLDSTAGVQLYDFYGFPGWMRNAVFRRYLFHSNRTTKWYAASIRDFIQHIDQPWSYDPPPEEMGFDLDTLPGKALLYAKPNPLGRRMMSEVFQFKTMMERKQKPDALIRATQLMIALHLHRLEHGAFPESLEPLVGAYFKEVPVDPFNGKPMQYSRKDLKVFSVGVDGKAGTRDDVEAELVEN